VVLKKSLIFILILILESFLVRSLPLDIETDRCHLYTAYCDNLLFGCPTTGNEVCARNAQENYCAITDIGSCDERVILRNDCVNCVLCCDYDPNLAITPVDWCEGPGETDINKKESVRYTLNGQEQVVEDSCIGLNKVRENICIPAVERVGCESPKPGAVISADKYCERGQLCINGECVEAECVNDEDCPRQDCSIYDTECKTHGEVQQVCSNNVCIELDERECFEKAGNVINEGGSCNNGEGICQNGECVEELPCPVTTCSQDSDCRQCCGDDGRHYRNGVCSEEGICVYQNYSCSFGCIDELGCCGYEGDFCCEGEDECYGDLTCSQENICITEEETCTKDTYRCDPNDNKKRQKCVELNGITTWAEDVTCPLGCNVTTGECLDTGDICIGIIPCNQWNVGQITCCNPGRYVICGELENGGYGGIPSEGIPCGEGEICRGVSGTIGYWEIRESENETLCVDACVDLDCGAEYECDGNTSVHNYCSKGECMQVNISCEAGCNPETGRCREVVPVPNVPCGSKAGASCCSNGECTEEYLACNDLTGICEYCGGKGELCCERGEACNEGYICGDNGRCDECEIMKLEWENSRGEKINTSIENQKVYAVVEGNGICHKAGYELDSLTIYEKNSLWAGGNREVESVFGSALTFDTSNKIRFEWNSEMGQNSLEAKYFFEAITLDNEKYRSDELTVLLCNTWYHKEGELFRIMSCNDYNYVEGDKKAQCLADCAGAAARESVMLGFSGMTNPSCEWIDGNCSLKYENSEGENVGESGTERYNCIIKYEDLGSCNEGEKYRTVTYIAQEVDENGNVIEGSTRCDAGCGTNRCTKEILCPSVVKVPFFNFINAVISLVIIGAIYVLIKKKWE